MAKRVPLNDDQKASLAAAIEGYQESKSALGRRVGLSPSDMSKLVGRQKGSLPHSVLRGLVSALRLDFGSFFAQYELELDDHRIHEIQQALAEQLHQLRNELENPLRGSAFVAFVGIRVEGAVEKVYEGRVPLAPQPARPRRKRNAATKVA